MRPSEQIAPADPRPLVRSVARLPRVLVLDDDQNVLDAMRRMLRGRYDVTVVQSPEVALSLLERDAGFAVIVSDFHMPVMTGAQFFEAAMCLAPHAIRVLLTGSSEPSTAIDAINLGKVFRFLNKPMSSSELRVVLGEACAEFEAATLDRDELRELRLAREADSVTAAQRRFEIEQAIKGGMHTVYQPIVRLEDGVAIGHEALSRFPGNPDRTPDRWFDEAAALDMGIELDAAALRLALSNWQRVGPGGQSLWLNLAPATVVSGAVHDLVLAAAHPVVLEITERTPVDDYDVLSDALAPLRERGIRLAIDDVGAGYSSLRHVTELRPDVVKLDRSIITDLGSDHNRQALVSSLIAFANESGITALGEGIETRSEAGVLAALRATYGQGYHFGRPAERPVHA